VSELSVIEKNELDKCETVIQKGMLTFRQVGSALLTIRENKLYRTAFSTFDDYCQHRWQWTKQHAHRLIAASETIDALEENPAIDVLPKNERQTRPLRQLHVDDRAEAWQQALEENDNKPTEKDVQSVVDRRKPTIGMDGPADWYTPKKHIDLVTEVLGRIELDAASCAEANETVGATSYYAISEGRDGLREPWMGRVYLNPPYGRKVIQDWIEKAVEEFERGSAEQIIVCINNATDTQWFAELWNYSLCFVKGRIKFYGPHNKTDSPAHGTVFAYFGDNNDLFAEVFKALGPVLEYCGDGDRKLHLQE
jgi:hypothetical protein